MSTPDRTPDAWTRLMACRRRVLDDLRPSEEARRHLLAHRRDDYPLLPPPQVWVLLGLSLASGGLLAWGLWGR